jgi:SAM-dependent methyltransferase
MRVLADFRAQDLATKSLNRIKKRLPEDSTIILYAGYDGGYYLTELSQLSHKIIGLDISFFALTEARRRGAKNLAIGDLGITLPFKNHYFDCGISIEVIEHLLKPTLLISELNRVLKPEGKLILSTPYHGLIKNIAIALLKFENHFKVEGAHIRFFTIKSLKSILKRNGFETKRIELVGRIPPLAKGMILYATKTREV